MWQLVISHSLFECVFIFEFKLNVTACRVCFFFAKNSNEVFLHSSARLHCLKIKRKLPLKRWNYVFACCRIGNIKESFQAERLLQRKRRHLYRKLAKYASFAINIDVKEVADTVLCLTKLAR